MAVAVDEGELLAGMADLAREAGLYACPEGGATLAALRKLRAAGRVGSAERIVIFNTGSGLKYPEAWRMALAGRRKGSASGPGPSGTPGAAPRRGER